MCGNDGCGCGSGGAVAGLEGEEGEARDVFHPGRRKMRQGCRISTMGQMTKNENSRAPPWHETYSISALRFQQRTGERDKTDVHTNVAGAVVGSKVRANGRGEGGYRSSWGRAGERHDDAICRHNRKHTQAHGLCSSFHSMLDA